MITTLLALRNFNHCALTITFTQWCQPWYTNIGLCTTYLDHIWSVCACLTSRKQSRPQRWPRVFFTTPTETSLKADLNKFCNSAADIGGKASIEQSFPVKSPQRAWFDFTHSICHIEGPQISLLQENTLQLGHMLVLNSEFGNLESLTAVT